MQYISSKEAAERWGLTVRSVQYFCKQGRIPGAKNLGKQWLLPADACHPLDKHSAAGKSEASGERYRFPLYIFSPAYAAPDSLTEMEKKLLDVQMLLLKEDQSACIRCGADLIRESAPAHILMGAWFSIAMASIPMGIHTEYRRALDTMDSILNSAGSHQEDYRLLINYVRLQLEGAHRLVDEIDISRLSSDALPFYQYFLLYSYVFAVDRNPDILRLSEAACRLIRTEGILPLETVMQLTLGTCYTKQSDLPHAYTHIEPACRTAMENGWIRLPGKYSIAAEVLIRKCLGAREFERLQKIAYAGTTGWQLINQIEAGVILFDGATSEQLSVMYQIYFGSSNENICSDLQISPAALKSILKVCCQITGTKNKADLKKHLKSRFSSELIANRVSVTF